MQELVWNVYHYSQTTRKIEVWNIFHSLKFGERIERLIKKKHEKEAFAEKVKGELMYCFLTKYEYEITVCKYPRPETDAEDLRVDVFDQVMLNFDAFIDYLYASVYGTKNGKHKEISSDPQIGGRT